MKVLVIGSGGREHALAWKLSTSSHVSAVFVGPGNAGTAEVGTNIASVNPLDFPTVLAACRENSIDCVFVGPEAPLAAGIVDFLSAEGISAIGPGQERGAAGVEQGLFKSLSRQERPAHGGRRGVCDAGAFESYIRGARREGDW